MRHGKAVTNKARHNKSFPLPVQVTATDIAGERSENSLRGPNRGWIDYITRCLADYLPAISGDLGESYGAVTPDQ
jgi:hypothetical protein